MRIVGAAIAAACLFQPAAAQAQGADLTRLTCGRLLDQRGVEPERLLVWLHGYYAGAAQRATLEPRQIEEAVAAMRKACEGNRELALDRRRGARDLPEPEPRGRGQAGTSAADWPGSCKRRAAGSPPAADAIIGAKSLEA